MSARCALPIAKSSRATDSSRERSAPGAESSEVRCIAWFIVSLVSPGPPGTAQRPRRPNPVSRDNGAFEDRATFQQGENLRELREAAARVDQVPGADFSCA